MKIINLIRSFPILLTLVILIFLNLNNQKEYTKLKILIWETPSLTLGTYISLSAGSGFILSYIISTSIARANKLKQNQKIGYKVENPYEDNILNDEPKNENIYDKNLIERDIKDPTPTIKASFRVIGKANKKEQTLKNDYIYRYDDSGLSNESDYQYYKEEINYKNDTLIKPILNDWEDDTYSKW